MKTTFSSPKAAWWGIQKCRSAFPDADRL